MKESYVQNQADKLQLDKMDTCSIRFSGVEQTRWLEISSELAKHLLTLIDQEYKRREEQNA